MNHQDSKRNSEEDMASLAKPNNDEDLMKRELARATDQMSDAHPVSEGFARPNNIDPLRVILSRNKAFYFTASKVGNGTREATQIGVSVVRNYFDDYLDDDAAIAAIRLLMVQERLAVINDVFELSPKGSFNHWKPVDALRFYERLKAYEIKLQSQLKPNQEDSI